MRLIVRKELSGAHFLNINVGFESEEPCTSPDLCYHIDMGGEGGKRFWILQFFFSTFQVFLTVYVPNKFGIFFQQIQ